ncbi:hypothetical protein [Legionella cincinnatiensis]|uniref:Coiled-coil protein n=1 Tax=Legionella cincinnatiensis TaxID=28085 RepID=A0A378ILR9_9GAMM|nr:hypothetical protein [Legionella cincinnatiensis]KTC88414.1 coiled-coil protein [Legionella cincinnatiensis]STX36099.1 coiled-coil protein [Legionella cincinnatiensis]
MRKSQISLIKHAFFNNSYEKHDFSFKEDEFNLDQLRKEFSLLHQVVLSNKSYWLNDNEAVFYLLYLCDVLILYYQSDYVNSDLQKLKQLRKEIETIFHNDLVKKPKVIHKFPDFILNELRINFQHSLSIFMSVSEIRKCVGDLNAKRSRFTYSRSLAKYFITYLQKSSIAEFIQEINKIIDNPYSFTEGMDFLNKSSKAITNLGIALFTFRFLLNLILMIKHLIQSVMRDKLSANKVLQQEMEKRGFVMASDMVWATVSLLTTYNHFFHIAQALISPIVVTFLIFDSLLLLAQWIFEANQHNERLQELQAQQKEATFFEYAVIQRQIDVLNDEWESQCSYFAINIFAANIIAVSFAISMLCTGPLALAGLAFFGMLGNALYNTSEHYKKYQKAKLTVQRELLNGAILNDEHHQQLLQILNEEHVQSYQQFWKALGFNVGGIAFIITAAAASWPIALGLTLAYMIYCVNDAYQKQRISKEETHHDVYRLLNSPDMEEVTASHTFQN